MRVALKRFTMTKLPTTYKAKKKTIARKLKKPGIPILRVSSKILLQPSLVKNTNTEMTDCKKVSKLKSGGVPRL